MLVFVGTAGWTAAAEDSFVLLRTDGSVERGPLKRLDSRSVYLGTGQFGWDNVVRLERLAPSRQRTGPVLLLANGDCLAAQPALLQDESLIARIELGRPIPVKVPLEAVSAILLNPGPLRRDSQKTLVRLKRLQPDEDIGLLVNGDTVAGELLDLDGSDVSVMVGKAERKIPRTSIRAIALNSKLISFPPIKTERTLLLGLRNGTWLTVVEIQSDTDGTLLVRTAYGEPLPVPMTELQSVRIFSRSVVPLVRLPSTKFKYMPFVGGSREMESNVSNAGTPLLVRGREFPIGLGMYPQMRASWSLGRQYERFLTTVAVDDAANGHGSVVFRIEVDGKLVFESGTLTGSDGAIRLDAVDLRGAESLTLSVDFSTRGDILDYADWCDAVLIRADAEESRRTGQPAASQ